jgi:hypothetical protein
MMSDVHEARIIDYSYEIVNDEDGDMFIVRNDGVGLSMDIFNDMLELSKQNPEFFDHWIALMESYLFLVPPPGEA